jgi:hypothetical protein
MKGVEKMKNNFFVCVMSVVVLLGLSVAVYAATDVVGDGLVAGYDIVEANVDLYTYPAAAGIPERAKVSLDMGTGGNLPGMVVVEFDVDNDLQTGGSVSMLGIFPSCEPCTSAGCPGTAGNNRIKSQAGMDIAVFIMLRGQGDDTATAFCADCKGPSGNCAERGAACDGCDEGPNCFTVGATCDPGDPNCYVIGNPENERCSSGGGDCTLGSENCYDMTVQCDDCAVSCGEGRKRGEWYITAVSLGGTGGGDADRGRIEMPLPLETDVDSADCYTLPFKRIVEAAKAAGGDFDIAAAEDVANIKWQVSAWYDPDFATTENDFFGVCAAGGTCNPINPCAEVSDVVPDVGAASSAAGDADTYCETNADGDKNSDAQDVTKFLEDFGRSTFFKPCGRCNLNN